MRAMLPMLLMLVVGCQQRSWNCCSSFCKGGLCGKRSADCAPPQPVVEVKSPAIPSKKEPRRMPEPEQSDLPKAVVPPRGLAPQPVHRPMPTGDPPVYGTVPSPSRVQPEPIRNNSIAPIPPARLTPLPDTEVTIPKKVVPPPAPEPRGLPTPAALPKPATLPQADAPLELNVLPQPPVAPTPPAAAQPYSISQPQPENISPQQADEFRRVVEQLKSQMSK